MLKVGVQSAGWYDKNAPLESMNYIKECGFESIDFNIDHYLDVKTMSQTGEVVESLFDKPTEEVLEFFRPLKEASEKSSFSSICFILGEKFINCFMAH